MQASNFQLRSSGSPWLEPWLASAGFKVATHSGYFSGGLGLSRLKCRLQCSQLWQSTSLLHNQKEKDRCSCIDQSTTYLHVQSLRNFPTEKLCGEVVVVRLDSALLLGHLGTCTFSLERALLTIKYLYKARAKVVIVTSWDTVLQSDNPEIKSIDSFAEYLSSLLQLQVIPVDGAPGLTSFKKEKWVQNNIILFENLLSFRGEVANCNNFSRKLASDWRQ